MEFKLSHVVLYFIVGFLLAAISTMVLLVLFRPYLNAEGSESTRALAMYAPLIIGLPFGLRVTYVGRRYELRLGAALKKALFL